MGNVGHSYLLLAHYLVLAELVEETHSSYTEFPCCVYTVERVRLSKSLLDSANPYWVMVAPTQQTLAELVKVDLASCEWAVWVRLIAELPLGQVAACWTFSGVIHKQEQLEWSMVILRKAAVVYSIVQRSINRADSGSESLYLVQYFIVRALWDMASFGRYGLRKSVIVWLNQKSWVFKTPIYLA